MRPARLAANALLPEGQGKQADHDTKTIEQAWSFLDEATVRYHGEDIGTVAALATGADYLVDHIRADYWIDPTRLNSIYRYKTEQFGDEVANKYNIHVPSIPNWVYQWIPKDSGYFLGNIGPGRMDFRFLTMGNLLAVLSSLADKSQQKKILRLLEVNWETLVGSMPIKLCYPALKGKAWHILTGADGKNTPWSYY